MAARACVSLKSVFITEKLKVYKVPHTPGLLACSVLLSIGSEAQPRPAPTSVSVPLLMRNPQWGPQGWHRITLLRLIPRSPQCSSSRWAAVLRPYRGDERARREHLRRRRERVGIITRGTTPPFIYATLGSDGSPDWLKAWKVFHSGE